MADNIFSRFLRQPEEEEDRWQRLMRGEGDRFVSPSEEGSSRFTFTRPTEEIPYQRNFFERVFAPFEAPQQTLFSLVKSIRQDGFQWRDISESFKHGWRYANPFAEEQPILASEINEIFFGKDTNHWRNLGKSVAISLLFDPLAVAPLTRLAKLSGPGTALSDALSSYRASAGGRIRESLSKAGKRLVGEDRAERISSAVGQWAISKWWNTPEELKRRVDAYQQGIQRWREEGANVLKEARSLGGRKGHELMAQALESDAMFFATRGSKAEQYRKSFDAFVNQAENLGIHRDDFMRIYSRARALDDDIGEGLVHVGAITAKEFDALRGKHLRRMFMAFERPEEYLKRFESLNIPDMEKFSTGVFMQKLNKIRDELDNTLFRTPVGEQRLFKVTEGIEASKLRYFKEGSRDRFNVKHFAEDLEDFLNFNPDAPIADIMEHVKTNMLGGVMPEKLSKAIADHITGSFVTEKGSQFYADMFRSMIHNPGVVWHTFSERLEKVMRRKELPDWVRKELGEVTEFGPRIASEASEAGRVLETRKFILDLAGARRGDSGELLRDEAGKFFFEGTNILSPNKSDIRGAAVQIMSDNLGTDIKGMWASPSVARILQNIEGNVSPTNPIAKMAWQTMEGIRKATGLFKFFKVVADPVAQARNFIGNIVLADMAGLSPTSLSIMNKAFRELTAAGQGNIGHYMKIAQDSGVNLFQHTFSRQELQLMADALTRHQREFKNWDDVAGALEKVYTSIADPMASAARWAGQRYEFNEQLFKLGVFINRYDETISNLTRRGLRPSPEQQQNIAKAAGQFADRALFDYTDVPYIVDFARQYGIIPFLTFPWKATGKTAEVLFQHPHRVLKYPRTAREINDEFSPTPEQVRREISALPEWARDQLVVKLPWKDGFDREQFIDMSFFLPWYNIKEFGDSVKATIEGGGVIPREGILSPVLATFVGSLIRNEDQLGRPITTDSMSRDQKFFAYADFVYETFSPPSFVGGSRAKSMGRAMKALAQTSPSPLTMSVAGTVGDFMMGPGAAASGRSQEQGLDRQLRAPAPQANLTGYEGNLGDSRLMWLSAIGMHTIGSDPIREATTVQGATEGKVSDLHRERARILRNPNLSREEKLKRIMRLQEQINQARLQGAGDLRNIFQ